jgi:antirestriction protein
VLQPIMFTLRASVVPFQLLRPLPTIFASVSGVAGEGCSKEMPASVRNEFDSHLDCFSDMVNALGEMKALTPAEGDKLSRMVTEVKEAQGSTLCEKTSLFNRCLEEICESQKTAVKEECRAHPFVFRDIYRNSVRVKKLCLIYQDENNDRVSSLKEMLCDRCYYDVETRSEESIKSQPVHSDFVIYAPTQHAGDVYFDGMPKAGLPLLLMIDLGKSIEDCSIADLRRVFRHQQNNIDVLYSPFPPIQLFQKIDITYIQNLYKMSER